MNNYDQVRHDSKSRILLELIRQYEKPQEEVRMIEDSKQRSVIQIEKRFSRSDVNRIYAFPRMIEVDTNKQSINKPVLRNLDIIGYNTQRFNLSSTRPMSTSKGNSIERQQVGLCLKNEQILSQLKKAQDVLKKSQQTHSAKRVPQKNGKDNNSSICQELLKKIYSSNNKTKVPSASNLKTTDLYKNIENMYKTNKTSNKSPSSFIPQYLKKQNSSTFLRDNFIKIQNESMGQQPQTKYQAQYTNRSNNKTMFNISRQQTVNSCKSFEIKAGKLSPSPQHLFNELSYQKTTQTRHLTQFLKTITRSK